MSNEIISLGDIDHVRLRPGMYIGSTFTPDPLAREIEDNAYDELANGHANTITISNPNQGELIISDNGRGIPIHDVTLENGEVKDSIIVACTKLFSGAKFNQNAYDFSIGLHGVGLVAVNALSKFMNVYVKSRSQKNTYHIYCFEYATLVRHEIVQAEYDFSTYIHFAIDDERFKINNFNMENMTNRAKLVLAKYPNANIFINDRPVEKLTMKQFVTSRLDLNETAQLFNIKVQSPNSVDMADIYFTYGTTALFATGDVNLHPCDGQYIRNFQTKLSNIIMQLYPGITRSDVFSNLKVYISLIAKNMEFSSQSKEYMNLSVQPLLAHIDDNLIRLVKTSSFLKEHFTELLDRKMVNSAARKLSKKKKRISARDGFKDCINSPGDVLYIMEGQSADGTLSQFRDRKTEAILPISGKILNVTKSNIEKAVNSKKFSLMLEVLGVDLKNKKQKDFRYKSVELLCDADSDGLHIIVLVTMGIWYYAPELIRQKKVNVILPPLYGAVRGKKFIPIYSTSDVNNYQGYQIIRFKGIGEMSSNQLETVIRNNPKKYTLLPPTSKLEEEHIVRCITDTELKRRLCSDSRFSLTNLFRAIDSPT